MIKMGGAVALLLAVLVASPSVAQQTFHCESTEGRAQARIVGGQQASIDDWPWQVWVKRTEPDGTPWACGGSIIAPRWILTAAHCLADGNGVSYSDLKYKHEFTVEYGKDRPRGQPGIPVHRVIPHEGYKKDTGKNGLLANDIGLIRLTENIPGHRNIQLSSEKLDRVFARPSLCATVTGWGTTKHGNPMGNATLLRADVPIVPTDSCKEYYGDRLAHNTVCAGYDQGGVDSCQGDSGGPLIVRHGNSSRYVQVGVVSWGDGCAEPGIPGIYTRVSKYIDWIQSHTGR